MSNKQQQIAVLYLSEHGGQIAKRISTNLPDCHPVNLRGSFIAEFKNVWQDYGSIICVMATGIVVRAVAPLIRDKTEDPGIVVVDESARWAVSLLSGHVGGANRLAERVAECLGNTAVITTASDNLGLTSVDLWLAKNQLLSGKRDILTKKSAQLNRDKQLSCFVDMAFSGELPQDFLAVTAPAEADIIITHDETMEACYSDSLIAYPKTLFLGWVAIEIRLPMRSITVLQKC